jgi:hypothetical protein
MYLMCDFFYKLVYINPDSLSNELCSEIIELFEADNNFKYQGTSMVGYNPNVKNTTDLNITRTAFVDKRWEKIHNVLLKELRHNINLYIEKFQEQINSPGYRLFKGENLGITNMQVQHYKKNIGMFKYHDDSQIIWEDKARRVLVFIWYLNDVIEGGETEFCGTYIIKPQPGKLIIFPAEWTFPHRGLIPKSNDKFIITGWVFSY